MWNRIIALETGALQVVEQWICGLARRDQHAHKPKPSVSELSRLSIDQPTNARLGVVLDLGQDPRLPAFDIENGAA